MTTPETRSSISPPTTPPDFELEQEIDLGRYWRSLAWRWWLPLLAVVLGGVIGFAATSVARPYRSDVVLYLGQPLFPSGGQPIQTVSTNFQFVTQLITSTGLVREVAATVGVKPEQLRQATQIAAFTPEGPARQGTAAKIATISVVGFTPSRGKAAASALANAVIRRTKGYVGVKLSVYDARLARADRELKLIQSREAAANASQDALVRDKSVTGAEKLLLLAHYDNIINTNEARRTSIESSQLALREQVALAEQVELPRILEPAVAVRVASPSRRSHVAVGALIGLIVGVFAAILWDPITTRLRIRRTA